MLRAKRSTPQSGSVVDATIITAPSSIKNSTGKRDPEMHQAKKGNQWHHGTKAHIGADADAGLIDPLVGTADNVNDVTHVHALVYGKAAEIYADAGYQGVAKREEVRAVDATWHIALRSGKRRALDKQSQRGSILDKIEQLKASICAKVEYPFRAIKRQFGDTKVCHRGLRQNKAQLFILFTLSNFSIVRDPFVQTTV
jgi:IS5 family transposase